MSLMSKVGAPVGPSQSEEALGVTGTITMGMIGEKAATAVIAAIVIVIVIVNVNARTPVGKVAAAVGILHLVKVDTPTHMTSSLRGTVVGIDGEREFL